MTDTTDQQSVTVAQAQLCKRVFLHAHSDGWTGNQMRRDVQHVDAEKSWSLYVSNGALAKSVEATTPEPVPATNQAGEVERIKECWSAIMREFGHVFGDIDVGYYPEVEDMRKAVAALATQPATSQEGEKTIEILRRAIAWHGDMQSMATTREHWQQTVDEALIWVKANPEPGYPSFPSFALSATPTPPTLNSWANTPEAEHERILLMAEIELHLKSCRIFLTTREKMHPVGVDIHDELLAKVTAAIEATGSEKANG